MGGNSGGGGNGGRSSPSGGGGGDAGQPGEVVREANKANSLMSMSDGALRQKVDQDSAMIAKNLLSGKLKPADAEAARDVLLRQSKESTKREEVFDSKLKAGIIQKGIDRAKEDMRKQRREWGKFGPPGR